MHRPLSAARLALFATSLAGVLCAAFAVAGAPWPLAWTLLAFALHVLLATAGVLLPALGVFGEVLVHGSRERAEVALTFDDGPHPETTPRVLATLREHGVHATFFVLGAKAEAHPELVRAIAADGHELGVHGYRHDRLYALRTERFVAHDLAQACAVLERVTGKRPTLFRPPVGFVSSAIAVAAERAGLALIGFGARTRDGLASARPEAVLARASAALENGAIVLLHDAAERDDRVPASVPVLGQLLVRLRERGLRAVTVDVLRRAG